MSTSLLHRHPKSSLINHSRSSLQRMETPNPYLSLFSIIFIILFLCQVETSASQNVDDQENSSKSHEKGIIENKRRFKQDEEFVPQTITGTLLGIAGNLLPEVIPGDAGDTVSEFLGQAARPIQNILRQQIGLAHQIIVTTTTTTEAPEPTEATPSILDLIASGHLEIQYPNGQQAPQTETSQSAQSSNQINNIGSGQSQFSQSNFPQPQFSGQNSANPQFSGQNSQPQFNEQNSGHQQFPGQNSGQSQFNGQNGQPQFNGQNSGNQQFPGQNSGQSQFNGQNGQPQFNGQNSGQQQFPGQNSVQSQFNGQNGQPQFNGQNSGQQQFPGENFGQSQFNGQTGQPQFNGQNSGQQQFPGQNSGQPQFVGQNVVQGQYHGQSTGQGQYQNAGQGQFNQQNSAQGQFSGQANVGHPQFSGQNLNQGNPGTNYLQNGQKEHTGVQPQLSGQSKIVFSGFQNEVGQNNQGENNPQQAATQSQSVVELPVKASSSYQLPPSKKQNPAYDISKFGENAVKGPPVLSSTNEDDEKDSNSVSLSEQSSSQSFFSGQEPQQPQLTTTHKRPINQLSGGGPPPAPSAGLTSLYGKPASSVNQSPVSHQSEFSGGQSGQTAANGIPTANQEQFSCHVSPEGKISCSGQLPSGNQNPTFQPSFSQSSQSKFPVNPSSSFTQHQQQQQQQQQQQHQPLGQQTSFNQQFQPSLRFPSTGSSPLSTFTSTNEDDERDAHKNQLGIKLSLNNSTFTPSFPISSGNVNSVAAINVPTPIGVLENHTESSTDNEDDDEDEDTESK